MSRQRGAESGWDPQDSFSVGPVGLTIGCDSMGQSCFETILFFSEQPIPRLKNQSLCSVLSKFPGLLVFEPGGYRGVIAPHNSAGSSTNRSSSRVSPYFCITGIAFRPQQESPTLGIPEEGGDLHNPYLGHFDHELDNVAGGAELTILAR